MIKRGVCRDGSTSCRVDGVRFLEEVELVGTAG